MYLDDTEYEETTLEVVKEDERGFEIRRADHWSFYIAKQYDDEPPHGVVPKVGDVARFYGRGIGGQVRGLVVNGRVVYYRTHAEQMQRNHAEAIASEAKQLHEFETRDKAILDAEYAALPQPFQRRIDRFRTNNPDFRWKYERYEMFCCTEAVKIARALKTHQRVARFERMRSAMQRQKVPTLAFDEHSGNTFGCAVVLAYRFLKEPDSVWMMHGALAPLVGSKEYGCAPRDTA